MAWKLLLHSSHTDWIKQLLMKLHTLHLFTWEDHGSDPPGRHVKAREGQVGDQRQPAWHHQGNVVPDQFGSLLCWGDGISGKREGN